MLLSWSLFPFQFFKEIFVVHQHLKQSFQRAKLKFLSITYICFLSIFLLHFFSSLLDYFVFLISHLIFSPFSLYLLSFSLHFSLTILSPLRHSNCLVYFFTFSFDFLFPSVSQRALFVFHFHLFTLFSRFNSYYIVICKNIIWAYVPAMFLLLIYILFKQNRMK